MKKFLYLTVMALLIFSTQLFAAGQQDEKAVVEVTADEDAAIVTEAGSGDLKLIFWNGLTGSDGVTLDGIIENYTKKNTDVSVRVEKMEWSTYFDKLLTSLVSGNPPDLFLLHEFEIPQFASQGVLLDTSDFFKPVGPIDKKDFEPAYLKALEYEGGFYGVPLDRHGWGVVVNNKLFHAAGIDPTMVPKNEAEFIALAQKLTLDASGKNATQAGFDAKNVVQWGTHTSWLKPQFLTILWQNGGDWTDGKGNATLNTAAAKSSLQFLYDLIYKYHVAPIPAGFDGWQSFANDQVAIIPEGCWMFNFLEDNKMDYSVWEYPRIGKKQAAVWTSGHVFYMPAGLSGEKLAAAKDLINYMFNNTKEWATAGMPPASLSVRNSLDPAEVPIAVTYGKSFARQGRFDQGHVAITEIIDKGYMPELDACLNGLKTVDEALNDANDTVQSILDRGF
ncbi:ABC transporter substrate-binding protein [Oceanispirochaeta sp.]|jgi:ABC-type glycerol-3-phosphate transport system substrate-binding protein|uniref:ABC transporter substrate-binding protein n=1 Tax=Oceanispirochaeta sp. TaxID=2035350 RepID=UPI002636F654|nr:ABC transporter substrate-binding protein [Oceanispirochaeta sp.]MDA3956722.1 ABC transporter substrate-binding protein [Oceanispirochaeta sp.]